MNFSNIFTLSSWWGKLLGALFGYLIFGPVGAIVGIFVGNFFDKGFIQYYTNPYLAYHAEKNKTIKEIFFNATFSVLGHIAKSDGRVSKAEITMAETLMGDMKLTKKERKSAKHLFQEGKQPQLNLDEVLKHLKKTCSHNPELLKLFLEIQYRAAQVDGLGMQKIEKLNRVFTQLGYAPLNKQYRFFEDFNDAFYTHHNQEKTQNNAYSHHKPRPPQHPSNLLSQAYALLEVHPDSSKQEVKKAYRRLISRHHPDKLIAKGLSESEIKTANDKTQKLTKAYELICESKGW